MTARPRAAVITVEILKNIAMMIPPVARYRMGRSRAAGPPEAPDAAYLARHAYDPFDLVCQETQRSDFSGLTVAELGPGDHIPVALLFLAAGATRYLAFDRFASAIHSPAAISLYERLQADILRARPALGQALSRRDIHAQSFHLPARGLVEYRPNPAEDASAPCTVDVLFSYNVLEHVRDVREVARATWALLKPGGLAVHRVDFGPHDAWARRHDPLEWLTIPDVVWRLSGSHRGTPNRARFHEVDAALRASGFHVQSRILEELDEGVVAARRRHLARRFRGAAPADLAVQAAVFTCGR